jgi:predicted nucleic acid-binding protein
VTFADVPAGEVLFLDANPLVYHFGPDPAFGPASSRLLDRITNQELRAVTSTHVLSEVAHHLMVLEAATRFGWTSKVVNRLKQQPAEIAKLTNFRRAVEAVAGLNVLVISVQSDQIAVAAGLSQQFGLLSNDALIVAVMQSQNLTHLASNDADFDRVPGITRYGPV